MIKIIFYRNANDNLCGFEVTNHGESTVCAAISLITLNTYNSLKSFVDEDMTCEYNPTGGFLSVHLPNIKKGNYNNEAELLLKTLELGVCSVDEIYPNNLKITYIT
ncbi:MAG: ribosomal-processing cysteine protease Prp [Firmicutes bacterium]|nr:ribosomal-processing cysteine protease Prp [Bacillota bacterium]